MRNLNGYLRKTLLIFSILFLALLPFKPVNSQTPFIITSDYYHIWDGNNVSSTIYLTISTETQPTVITYYTITIPDGGIVPEIYSVNRDTKLEPTIHRRETSTDLVIDLKKTPVSPDNPVTLKITYSTQESGNSLSLVSSISDTQSRTFSFTYPSSRGEVTWSSTPVVSSETKDNNIEVITAPPQTSKVNISVGEGVAYEYHINRKLINMGNEMIISELTLPVNNSKQHILVTDITPLPDKAYMDIDGNYVLQYSISSQSSIDVLIDGYLVMTDSTYPYTQSYSIEENKIWKITDASLVRHVNRYIKEYGLEIPETFSDIENLTTNDEKQIFLKGIYQYVIDNLQPNTLTLGSLTGAERQGGQETLLKQSISTSEDYTDAIISLYRYFNIPARLVIGYITDMSDSTSDGMYHYWAEYFDSDLNSWIMVDPFLEDYSKTSIWGTDMKDHVTLIYRYSNPNTPILPYYSKENLQIKKTANIPNVIHNLELDLLFEPYKITNPYFKGSIGIINTGNTILDTFNISKSNIDLSKYIDYIENNTQVILLPTQTHYIKFNIPSKELTTELFATVNVLSGTEKIDDMLVESDIEIVKSYTNLEIFSKLLSLLIYLLCTIPLYFLIKKVQERYG